MKNQTNAKIVETNEIGALTSQFKNGSVFMDNVVSQNQNIEINIDPKQMTKGLLLIGKMGSGKTEMVFNFLDQNFYNRAIIHQTKKDEITERFYRPDIDIIFNPYDSRGTLWDVMSEDEGIVKTFFENYMNSVMGDKKDFFSSTANRLFNETMIKIKTQYKNETNAKKWLLFIQSIKEMFAETMESMLEPLEIMAEMMQNPQQETFVINDFFQKQNQCKLILDNNPKFTKQLTPLFSAFLACVAQVHTSRADTNEDFTLYAIDEYLSLVNNMDENATTRLHTLIRSKGGILIMSLQYLPADDIKMKQLLTSSVLACVYFSVDDQYSIEFLKSATVEIDNISEAFNSLKDYEHISFFPNEKIIYKGYTPQIESDQK